MKLEKKWREVQDAVLKRTGGRRLWWLTVAPYPLRAWLKEEERCSLCKTEWYNVNAAINHVCGLPHFRQWCLDHHDRVRDRFPEAVLIVTEDAIFA